MEQKERLDYALKYKKLTDLEVAEALGVNHSYIAKLRKSSVNALREMHIVAICYLFNIPIEIFKNKNIGSEKEIKKILDTQKIENSIFYQDYRLLNKLTKKNEGIWYFYSYPSTISLANVWITKTQFFDDFSVIDEHNNKGKLFIGKNQSIIIKESSNSKNITSITFDNARVFYNAFIFSRVSKSNGANRELFNFGISSRKKLDKNLVKEILGDMKEVQLQVNYSILERIAVIMEIEG